MVAIKPGGGGPCLGSKRLSQCGEVKFVFRGVTSVYIVGVYIGGVCIDIAKFFGGSIVSGTTTTSCTAAVLIECFVCGFVYGIKCSSAYFSTITTYTRIIKPLQLDLPLLPLSL